MIIEHAVVIAYLRPPQHRVMEYCRRVVSGQSKHCPYEVYVRSIAYLLGPNAVYAKSINLFCWLDAQTSEHHP